MNLRSGERERDREREREREKERERKMSTCLEEGWTEEMTVIEGQACRRSRTEWRQRQAATVRGLAVNASDSRNPALWPQ